MSQVSSQFNKTFLLLPPQSHFQILLKTKIFHSSIIGSNKTLRKKDHKKKVPRAIKALASSQFFPQNEIQSSESLRKTSMEREEDKSDSRLGEKFLSLI